MHPDLPAAVMVAVATVAGATVAVRVVVSKAVEGMVVVGMMKDNDSFGTIAGLISPVHMAGILESVKLQILLG